MGAQRFVGASAAKAWETSIDNLSSQQRQEKCVLSLLKSKLQMPFVNIFISEVLRQKELLCWSTTSFCEKTKYVCIFLMFE